MLIVFGGQLTGAQKPGAQKPGAQKRPSIEQNNTHEPFTFEQETSI